MWLDGACINNVTAISIVLPRYGATGALYFNYTGVWSNHTFELVRGAAPVVPPVVPPSGGGGGGGGSLVTLKITVLGDDALVIIKDANGGIITSHNIKAGKSYNFTFMSGSYTVEAKGTKKTITNSIVPGGLSITAPGSAPNQMVFDFTEKVPGFEMVVFVVSNMAVALILYRRKKE